MIGQIRGNFEIVDYHSTQIDKYNQKDLNNYYVKCLACGAEQIRNSRQFRLLCECKNGVNVLKISEQRKFDKEIRDLFL